MGSAASEKGFVLGLEYPSDSHGSFEAFPLRYNMVEVGSFRNQETETVFTRPSTFDNSNVMPRTGVSDFARCDFGINPNGCFVEMPDSISLSSKSVYSLCCVSFRNCCSQQSFETPPMHVFLEGWCSAFDFRCIRPYEWINFFRFGEAERSLDH